MIFKCQYKCDNLRKDYTFLCIKKHEHIDGLAMSSKGC